jgi:uncharacterized protein YbbK (DUF523 family)
MVRPILIISACLEFDKVRYDGGSIPSKTIRDFSSYVELIKVCPEFEIGLGVPRDPIRIVKKDNEYRLIQHNTNRDVTDLMVEFSKNYIEKINEVDGFVFKSKSPTMGLDNIKVYSGMKGAGVVEKCGGFFSSDIAKKYKGYPIEEEDRLNNAKIREHFITKLFLFARYREAIKNNKLNDFDENNRLLFEFYNFEIAKELDIKDENYFDKIKKIMAKPPHTNEIYLFFEKIINDDGILSKYKNNKVGFETLKEVSRYLIKDRELLNQTFYNPYPIEIADSIEKDRERDYFSKISYIS